MRRLSRWLWLAALAAALLLAARVVASHEQRVPDSEASEAHRMTVEELVPGGMLSFELADNVDALRLVAYPFRRAAGPKPTIAGIRVAQSGAGFELAEQLVAAAESAKAEAVSDDGLTLGSRLSWNIEVKRGAARATVSLARLADADGLLVRCYRRQTLDSSAGEQPWEPLSHGQRQALAARLSTNWVDLDRHARHVSLATRWLRVSALADSTQAPVAHLVTELAPTKVLHQAATADAEPVADVDRLATLTDFVLSDAQRPAVVEAGATDLVLRVSARIALEALDHVTSALDLTARIESPNGAQTIPLSASVDPAPPGDRFWAYGRRTSIPAVSSPARFFLIVPAHGRLTVWPQRGEVAVSLAELDPLAAPKPRTSAEQPRAAWRGWVPRRPSNWGDFTADARGVLSLAIERAVASAAVQLAGSLERVRVTRPESVRRPAKPGFVSASTLTVAVGPSGGVLNLRLAADSDTELTIRVDDGTPRRRRSGLARYVTVDRSLFVRGETPFSLLLGDDLEPGQHRVTFVSSRAIPLWVRAPWARQRSAKSMDSRWIAGDLAP